MDRKRDHDRPSERRTASFDDDVGRMVRMAGPRPTMPAESVDRMRDSLRPLWEAEVSKQVGSFSWGRLAAVAAVLMAAVGALLMTRSWVDRPPRSVAVVERLQGAVTGWQSATGDSARTITRGAEVLLGGAIGTSDSARAALLTHSGHSVRIDHDSKIVLLSATEIGLERGAVYIDSGDTDGSDGTGLTVITPVGAVREIGTQFEVRLAAESLRVRIREGSVRVDTSDSKVEAVAGEQLVLRGEEVHRSRIDPYDSAYQWVQDLVPDWSLDGSTLDSFLRRAAREAGYHLDYSAEGVELEAATVTLNGNIEGLTPIEALEVVLPAVGYGYRIEDQGVLAIFPQTGRTGS